MIWSGYRPSDDPCMYHYHIPSNIFATVGLLYAQEMLEEWGELEYKKIATKLRNEVIAGIDKHGIVKDRNGHSMYCYETDGFFNCNKMDDANIPSLLSLPYLDPMQTIYKQEVYQNTKDWILSRNNPYYFQGNFAKGIGSPHTYHGYVWPMSLIVQAYLSEDIDEQTKLVKILVDSTEGTMHESFDVNYPKSYSRSWFAWADTLFSGGNWCKEYVDKALG